jgi:hypothetical protein
MENKIEMQQSNIMELDMTISTMKETSNYDKINVNNLDQQNTQYKNSLEKYIKNNKLQQMQIQEMNEVINKYESNQEILTNFNNDLLKLTYNITNHINNMKYSLLLNKHDKLNKNYISVTKKYNEILTKYTQLNNQYYELANKNYENYNIEETIRSLKENIKFLNNMIKQNKIKEDQMKKEYENNIKMIEEKNQKIIDDINKMNENNKELKQNEEKNDIIKIEEKIEKEAVENIDRMEEDFDFQYEDLILRQITLYFNIIYYNDYHGKITSRKTGNLYNFNINIDKNLIYFYKNNIHENVQFEINTLDNVDIYIKNFTLYYNFIK